MRTYKVTDENMKCRGFQFELGIKYKTEGEIIPCENGFHSCLKASDCFSYYSFDSTNRVFECEISGIIKEESDKKASEYIVLLRELSWLEVLELVNSGKNNTGLSNSGNSNSGDSNSGDGNSGDRNSGNWNSGNSNSGDSNSGYRNSGDSNSGYRNSGDGNSGNSNSGDGNSGDRNSGDWNSGNRNSGDGNSGNWNSGNRNSGNWNSGNWNSGNSNSGDSNSGYRNSGAFCIDNNPKIYLFDLPTDIYVKDWEQSKAISIMREYLIPNIWIHSSQMTEKEKQDNPKYETTDGYLKSIPMKDAWSNMWHNLNEENKNQFLSLPNFDAKKFEIITGIDVTK